MNPWFDISLSDYEAHMASPEVAQAQLLAEMLGFEIDARRPKALALLGCAGGNGLERVPSDADMRVVVVDINPKYIETARKRFSKRLLNANFAVHDIETSPLKCPPFDLVFAGLLFEYVDTTKSLFNIWEMLEEGGMLVAVLQLPSPGKDAVTATRYKSLSTLEGFMRLVPPEKFAESAKKTGFRLEGSETRTSSAGKRFELMRFLKAS